MRDKRVLIVAEGAEQVVATGGLRVIPDVTHVSEAAPAAILKAAP